MNYDPKNPRVKLAREKRRFNNPPFTVLLIILIIALLAGGIALIFLKNSLSWLLIGFSVVPVIILFWTKNALKEIPAKVNSNDFTDLISEDLLLLLKPDFTTLDLIPILPKTRSGLFLMARFELPIAFFEQITPNIPIENIYSTACEICHQLNSTEITGSILAVAIIKNRPDYEQILKYFQLSIDDLYQGIIWFNYLNGLVKSSKKHVRTGGIARDFAFGYTPTLERFATNLSNRYINNAEKVQQAENAEIFEKMIHIFSHPGRENVALIGAYGSGRSTIVSTFAETLMNADSNIPNNLRYRQIYSLNASSLISAAKNPGDLEYLLIAIMNEVYSAKNIILCLDNAHLFFEEGPGSIDISNLLLPILENGAIRIILIMDDQKFLEISAKNPALASSINKIMVHPTDRIETLKILMDQIPYIESQKNVTYTYHSLTEAYRLSEQYIHDVVMPGKARLLLESAASFAENGFVTTASVQNAVEQSYGVKVKIATATEDRDKLLNLESLIHERMIDQAEAVSAVSNSLRRAAAGIKNQGRPIGTFLFLGPTGVGKTELAKALAATYFGGEDDIIRLDMNEFVSSDDVARLIRDGATDALSLTAEVMKKPFSVVLLDEIEKAHPAVLTTLLQVLDEGILRDEKNREISFRDCIIIATSNAGADTIREKISAGQAIGSFKDELIDSLITNNEFKPEFLNRFDEICLFSPLSKEDLLKVLDLMIASTNKTLSNQKISVVVTDEAKQILIEKGYDPKMGARPMRRIVQKTVENIVASAILSGAATPGSTLTITPSSLTIDV
ncbi:ATP-dependent Clp protease ATP-binding subunit [Candidatus Saccharibacteria bacterium]|nr:ATP-dependent Clp protease ATP-binding subunit [Candidatus Saccharibacteria bacterium]